MPVRQCLDYQLGCVRCIDEVKHEVYLSKFISYSKPLPVPGQCDRGQLGLSGYHSSLPTLAEALSHHILAHNIHEFVIIDRHPRHEQWNVLDLSDLLNRLQRLQVEKNEGS